MKPLFMKRVNSIPATFLRAWPEWVAGCPWPAFPVEAGDDDILWSKGGGSLPVPELGGAWAPSIATKAQNVREI